MGTKPISSLSFQDVPRVLDISNPIDARMIEQRIEHFEYGAVFEFAADVLLMLDNAARFYKSPEVSFHFEHDMFLKKTTTMFKTTV